MLSTDFLQIPLKRFAIHMYAALRRGVRRHAALEEDPKAITNSSIPSYQPPRAFGNADECICDTLSLILNASTPRFQIDTQKAALYGELGLGNLPPVFFMFPFKILSSPLITILASL